jgi:long-chain acyl-CoA synthetase
MKGLDPGVVTPQKNLGDDLDLDSLGRVELLSMIEEELGVYLDETNILATTTVSQLESRLSQSKSEAASLNFGQWGRKLWCRPLRGLLQRLIVFPGLKLMYRYRIQGRENLNGLPRTVLFAANHTVRLDNALIIRSLPYRWRRRLAIAAWDHLWTSWFQRIIIPLMGNGFPFAKEGRVRSSLNNFGRLLDENWSVLIYPEGQRTDDGPMQPFLNGIGMVAVESQLPVVPIKVDVHSLGYPKSYPFLKRGQVEVRLGKPLTFKPGTPYPEATRVIERAVATL